MRSNHHLAVHGLADADVATRTVTADPRNVAGMENFGTPFDARTTTAAAMWPASPTTAGRMRLGEEAPEKCCGCYKTLEASMAYLDHCPIRQHLSTVLRQNSAVVRRATYVVARSRIITSFVFA